MTESSPASSSESESIRTFIWGSCVSRDTFGFLPKEFSLTRYVARQSLISAGTDARSVRQKIKEPSSVFQARMVRGDLAGDLYAALAQHAAATDVVLIDLVDERGGVVAFDDGYATKLNEFWSAGGREASAGARQIALGTDEHFELWVHGARRFVGALREAELIPKTLVLHAPWATQYDTGNQLEVPTWMQDPREANVAYGRYVAFLRDCGLRVVDLPEELARTSENHQWGASPFHYQDSAYEYFSQEIVALANEASVLKADLSERRDVTAWGDDVIEISSAEKIESLPDGSTNLTVWHNGIPIDLHLDNIGAPTTLVSFHAALGSSGLRPPIFTGRAISEGAGMNRIFVSDPGLLADDDLGLAWYLGTDALNLTRVLGRVIRDLQERMSGKHLVFFGMSGGGFAALNFSHLFEGSLAVPVNPQTRILDYAEIHWEAMARACFGAQSTKQARAILESHPRADQRIVYSTGFDNSVIYVQNAGDAHVSSQMLPWFEAIGWKEGAMALMGDWGNGHVPPPGAVLKSMLSSIAGVEGDWGKLAEIWRANPLPTREGIRERTGR